MSALLLAVLLSCGCGAAAKQSPKVTSFTNPVYAHDFPDPFVLRVKTTYFAYATASSGDNVPVLTSRDLVHWRGPTDALPSWAPWNNGLTWAPSVIRRDDGRFLMYYAGHDIASGNRHCIGVAVSRAPMGPFRDHESKALVCPLELGGAIDPDVFRDRDGSLYLYWKNDGNCCDISTHIFVQRLSVEGLRLTGPRVSLAINDQPWEANVVEAPTMWRHGNIYYLFYSGGRYDSNRYAVGYSRCAGPLGPCTENRANPILYSRCQAAGPGGEAIIEDRAGQTWMVYHAWPSETVGGASPGRVLWIEPLMWTAHGPIVGGSTCAQQPVPRT